MNRLAAAQALDSHLYDGLCPDQVEGYAVRDPHCFSCRFTDFLILGGKKVEPLRFKFEGDSAYFLGKTYAPMKTYFLATGERWVLESILNFFEAAAWCPDREWLEAQWAELLLCLPGFEQGLEARIEGMKAHFLYAVPS